MEEEVKERRASDHQLQKLTEITASVASLIQRIEEVHPTIEDIRKELREHIREESSIFIRAFPNGNPEEHRMAHEAWIRKATAEAKEAEDRAEIILAAKKKAAEMTVYGVLFALLVLFVYFWNGHMPASAQIPMPKL